MAPPQNGQGAAVATITVTASASSENLAKSQTPLSPGKNPSFNRNTPKLQGLSQLELGTGRGALIEIHPDSTVDTLWSANNESIFGLALRGHHVLCTTDSNGRIFDLDSSPNANNLRILTQTHEALRRAL